MSQFPAPGCACETVEKGREGKRKKSENFFPTEFQLPEPNVNEILESSSRPCDVRRQQLDEDSEARGREKKAKKVKEKKKERKRKAATGVRSRGKGG